MDNAQKAPPVRLRFKKNDLIIKEGDYGISIFKIVKGKVLIYNELGDKEVALARLGAGEVIGEMAFLSKTTEPRTASARALVETEVEVLHPARLSKEYQEMPSVFRYVADQVLRRVVRMNNILAKLAEVQAPGDPPWVEKPTSERLFYRKPMDCSCTYRPAGSSPKTGLVGRIRDISFRGAGLEVSAKNTVSFSHEKGDEFHLQVFLPNGKEVEFLSRIVYVSKNLPPGRLFMGMEITDIKYESRKALGFFLMP